MSKKRVSYQNLLKTAISEFDTSKTVDVKGPMLDPILKWDGQGELPIYKDAASILERYYFNESSDKGVEVAEQEYNEDGTEGSTAAEKDAKGAGTEQAGTSDKGSIPAEKKEIEKDLAKESAMGKDPVKPKKYVDEQDEEMEDDAAEEEVEESEDLSEDLENAVIEKLIAEMEEEDEEEEDDKEEEVKEGDMTYTGDGVKPGMEAPKEKKASGPEDDTEGAGTEQAGTGTAAGQVPDRKDNADKMVKPKNYNEAEEAPADDAADAEGEEAELNVDADIKEAAGEGAGPVPSMQKKQKGEDQGEDDVYEEAFQIFKEAIEDEEEAPEEEEKEEKED